MSALVVGGLFFVLWLLLLLLGESYLGYLLLAIGSVLLLTSSRWFDWLLVGQFRVLAVLSLLWLIWLVVSVVLSSSWPLSLHTLSYFLKEE